MDNQAVLQELQIKISAVQEIEDKIKMLHQEVELLLGDLKRSVIPWLNEIYSRWRPEISEPVVHVDFRSMTAFELFVTEINGLNVRAREGDKNAYHRFSLQNKIEDYETSAFILPVSIYRELSDLLEFQEYPTVRFDKDGKVFYETPSYFSKRKV
ncbi:MAG: hypothetical protein R2941_17510 [Desulfobacterales bacterium]